MTILLGIDIETTGLDPEQDRVIEIGAVLWDAGEENPIHMTSCLVNEFDGTVPPEITALTGITTWQIQEYGVSLDVALEKLISQAHDANYLVAHNADFEKSFLEKRGFEAVAGWVDTMTDIVYAPMKGHGSLSAICMTHGIFNPMPHRALPDALAMMQVLAKYDLEKVIERSKEPTILVVAQVNFEEKDRAKNLAYRWNRSEAPRQWSKKIKASDLDQEIILTKAAGFEIREVVAA